MKIKKLSLVLITLFLGLIGTALGAEAIEELTFQGRLTGSDGNPLNGSRKMSFVLYRKADGSEKPLYEWFAGAAQIPPETGFFYENPYTKEKYGTRTHDLVFSNGVPVYKGIYAVRLPFDQPLLSYVLASEDTLYIEVRVEGPSGYETLSPRVKVASSMFAMMANQVKWAKAKDDSTGNKGMGYGEDDTKIGIGCEPVDGFKVAIKGPVKETGGTGDGIKDKGALSISGGGIVFTDTEAFNGELNDINNVNDIRAGGSNPLLDGFQDIKGNSKGSITGFTVYNAVWNDLAEFRPLATGSKKIAGRAYLSTTKGLVLPTKRCQQGVIGICSDTYGFSLGGTPEDKDKLPIAISGWALAYVDKAYPIGTALVNGKDGILTKATFWEKTRYPERILAVVDMGPAEYNNLKVDGRTWVKVK